MSILKIQPDAISNTESFVFGNVTATSITANGVNLGTAVAEAFVLANSANKSTTSDTAPVDPKVGDSWFDTVTNVLLRYTNDGVSNNWIDITGPQNAGFIYQSYSLSSNTTSLNESGSNTSVALTVSTINNADGTTLYWTISGSTPADFTDSANSGSVNIINNSGTFTRTLAADVTTEGAESFIAQLRTGSTSGPIVAIAPVITVADTSLSPAPVTLWITGTDFYNGVTVGALAGAGSVGGSLSSPTQVGSTTTWSSLHLGAGSTHFAIRQDDTLWGWGSNGNGDLGISGSNRSSPTQIGSDTWRTVVNGGHFGGGAGISSHTVGIKKDNTLWGWGYPGVASSYGLGIGTGANVPTSITSGTWSSVSLAKNQGAGGLLAVKSDGTLWSCGYNGFGAIGDNTTTNRGLLVQIGNGTTWMSVVRSYNCSFAIKSDGTLWTWGSNNNGSLGLDRGTSYTSSPIQVGSLTNWSSIEASGSLGASVLAIKNDGTLWGWGRNGGGQLGTGNYVGYSSPVQIGTDNTWSKIATGGMRGIGGTDFESYTLGLKTNGTIWGWGTSFGAALGLPVAYRNSPTQIGSSTDWRDISAGVNTSAFLKY